MRITPHLAEKKRHNAIDQSPTTWEDYFVSQRRRKIVEKPFGWMKVTGGLGKPRHRRYRKMRSVFPSACACFNPARMSNLGTKARPA